MKFSIISLGCFRNSYDSRIIKEEFLKKGFCFQSAPQDAQVLLINTCGFIEPAKEESLNAINEALLLKRKKKIERLIVCGCLSERYQKELKRSYPEVDEWRGVLKFSKFSPPVQETKSASAHFLKICEGCLNKCTFCAIPLIKGNLKSRGVGDILKEVVYLNKKGIKELNLIGQDITSWGKDLKPKQELSLLLEEILKKSKNINWIRLVYTHPRHFSDNLIALIAQTPKICKYIDLPIQHINDRILKAMNRKITKKEIIDLISKIRKKIPGCAIRTAVIAGFPGETKEEFKELLNFLKDIQFDRLGAFIYSREEGTPAHDFKEQLPKSIKKMRYTEIMRLQKEISAKLNRKFIGKELEVLVEQNNGSHYYGRTQFDAPEVDGGVFIQKNNLKIGDFYRAKIVDAYEYDLVAV